MTAGRNCDIDHICTVNNIGEEAGVAIAEGLKSNSSLHSLDLWSKTMLLSPSTSRTLKHVPWQMRNSEKRRLWRCGKYSRPLEASSGFPVCRLPVLSPLLTQSTAYIWVDMVCASWSTINIPLHPQVQSVSIPDSQATALEMFKRMQSFLGRHILVGRAA
jgi:hypothetical protein